MTSTQALAAVLVLALATGVGMTITGIIGTRKARRQPRSLLLRVDQWWNPSGRQASKAPMRRVITIGAVVAICVVWLVSGWPVAGIIAGASVVGVPWIFTTGRDAMAAIDRLAGIESWIRRLRDTVAVGVGLQQAIAASRRYAPAIIHTEVNNLVVRLQAGWTMRQALHNFAEDLDDAAGDQVVAALLLNAEEGGDHLPDVLSGIADTAAKEVAMRKTVEAQRQEPRMVTKVLTGLTVITVVGGTLVPEYVKPYASITGQLVLAGFTGTFILLLIWIRRLTLPVRVPRFLATPAQAQQGQP